WTVAIGGLLTTGVPRRPDCSAARDASREAVARHAPCPSSDYAGRAMAPPPVTSVLALEGAVSMATYPADARIATQVSGYWTMRLDDPPARLRIVPDGRVDLV